MSTENASTPSRPLPRVSIEQPGPERGANDVREHLDESECALCGVPDAPRVLVEIPMAGKNAFRRVCRGHSEHPDHPGYASKENPTEYRFCPGCGDVDILLPNGLCLDCDYKIEDAR